MPNGGGQAPFQAFTDLARGAGNANGVGDGGAGSADKDADPLVYIMNPSKVMDMHALTSALDEWGISHGYELGLLDEAGLAVIMDLLKPIPRKIFVQKMKALEDMM